jgi:hypothetical protein
MADLTTQLSYFLTDLYAGTLGTTAAITGLNLTGTTPMIKMGGTTSSFPALKRNGSVLQVRLADDSGFATVQGGTIGAIGAVNLGGSQVMLISGTAPTIASGFGSTPSIVANNGATAFTVDVGTGGAATSGVITMPSATTGWVAHAVDQTTNIVTRCTASTQTSITLTAASAWTASDVLQVICFAY